MEKKATKSDLCLTFMGFVGGTYLIGYTSAFLSDQIIVASSSEQWADCCLRLSGKSISGEIRPPSHNRIGNMSFPKQIPKAVKEIRLHLCQTSKASHGVR